MRLSASLYKFALVKSKLDNHKEFGKVSGTMMLISNVDFSWGFCIDNVSILNYIV